MSFQFTDYCSLLTAKNSHLPTPHTPHPITLSPHFPNSQG
ncbi:hypothetical protein O53_2971 [Microcystis aeruginosa TAIHU98]|uniref:Uncharacterized protein n=1 Tax=Microcystis aeruginosa TAIHU98 TaxID=1134457 RepID=L7E3Y2_MICAE|nr:hypothetical protein O53_2971 [Microcystis aeruginosa TAIHU98]ODV37011.1 hypothetical protein BFG60_3499 [Microcystis aeruginosa NIES-98]